MLAMRRIADIHREHTGVHGNPDDMEPRSSAYPETRILTEDTGFSRRYGVDPYGQYNEKRGEYRAPGHCSNPCTATVALIRGCRHRDPD